MSEPQHLGEGEWLRLLRRGRWEYVTRTRGRVAAAIAALTDDGHIVFVEQARAAVDARTIELPAGLVGDVDEHESVELAARRELLEETGFDAATLVRVAQGPSSPGLSDEQVVMFVACDMRRVHEGGGDVHEGIDVHVVPLASADAWLGAQADAGKLVDLKVWAGLYFARRHRAS